MKIKTITNHLFIASILIASFASFAQGIPSSQWTSSERQFVDNARNLYKQQGISYSDEQASNAVAQMRSNLAAAPKGIPESEWSPQERQFIEQTKKQYESKGMAFTAEQGQITVKAMREQIAKITGTAMAFQSIASNPQGDTGGFVASQSSQNSSGNQSEEQIGRQIASWSHSDGPLKINSRRDGFDINGRPILDAEGKMFSYAFDVTSGAITYAVRTARGITIKTISAAPDSEPLVIATGAMGNSGWQLQTSTGKQLSGNTLSILSNGFLVGRTASAFRYQPGKGVKSIAVPDGYVITPLQRGNVGATGFVLLEKDAATGGNDPLSNIFSSMKAIGSIIGTNKKEDYALMDVASGKLYPLNIAADGKQQTLMSQCRQVNWAISECQRAQTVESVYGADGYKNNSHYYWLVNWVGTPTGPVAFTLEDGLAKLFITDLTTGKKSIAFDRSFGIADWGIEQAGDAKVTVKAKLAFEWKEIPDAVAFLQTAN